MDDFNHKTVEAILREMDAAPAPPDVKAITMVATQVIGPVIADYIKELRAADAELRKRIAELEARLDTAARLDAIEARLAALPSATIKRIA